MELLAKVEYLENYVFTILAHRNRNLIYMLKMCIMFYFGTIVPGYVFMVCEGELESRFKNKIYPKATGKLMKSMYLLGKEKIPAEMYERNAKKYIVEYEDKVALWLKQYPLIILNMDEQIWDLWRAFFFAYTVYTTLGYGEVYPLSPIGRFLTIIYTLVGLPLFILFLTDLGKVFTVFMKYVWTYIRRVYYTGSFRKHKKTDKVVNDTFIETSQLSVADRTTISVASTMGGTTYSETPTTPDVSTMDVDESFNLPITVALFVLVIYNFIGALLYSYFEQWTFFESFYYVFICLSTIGFGDFIPHNATCEIVSLFYECFGKALMAMCFNVVQEKLSTSFQDTSLNSASLDLMDMDDSGSISLLDILSREEDMSVAKILQIEEEEEARLGIKRTTYGGKIVADINTNPIDVPITVESLDESKKLSESQKDEGDRASETAVENPVAAGDINH